MAYQVWVFAACGDKTAYLENAYRVKRTIKANRTPDLSFSLPADDAKAIYLTSAYEVKIYNTVKAQWEGLYILDDATERWDASGSIIEANYSGVMGQLALEDNVTYDSTSTPQTPTTIITALLALQERADAITVGTIEPTTTFALAVENINLLAAVLKCPAYLGGYIEVDADRKLNWWNEPSGDPVREVRYQKNMRGVTRKRDFTSITNKLYAYGYGETEAQLTLIDAGEAAEYIEDATSQTTYGVRIRRITDKRITHPSTLLRWAQRVMAAYKDPIYYYTVDMVNLAEHPDYTFDLENIEVGQIIRVVNSDMNDLSVNVAVVSVTTDLSEPQDIQIELANATKTLADSIAQSADTSSVVNNLAVQIGAGQVTVQGVFTVDGWRTAGQTTINGGQITANTITAAKLTITPIEAGGAATDINNNTTTISGGKITTNTIDADAIKTSTLNAKTITLGTTGGDSIIKSGNYSAGSAGWQIKSDGTAEFGSVIVRGTIETATLETSKILTVKGTIQSNNFDAGSPYPGWLINGTGDVTTHDIVCRGALVVYETVEASGTITGNNLVSTHYVTAGTYVKITPGSDPGVQNALWVNSSGYLYYRLGSTNYLLAP